MPLSFNQKIPVLTEFEQVADWSIYKPLPSNWQIGIADVVNSTKAILSGRYKEVNFAGAATISALSNALGGKMPLFAFGGDGAHFAVPPEQAAAASTALSQVAAWTKKELNLDMRVGMIGITAIRNAGFEVGVAHWQASQNVKYALFAGGGLEWAEEELKAGSFGIVSTTWHEEPDLTGLSCQWGPVRSSQGKIISLIVKRAPETTTLRFAEITKNIVLALKQEKAVNPVNESGPEIRWPTGTIDTQSRTGPNDIARLWKRALTLVKTVFYLGIFKSSVSFLGFQPNLYRADLAANADFQKFNDGLMMTMDCRLESIETLKQILNEAAHEGIIRYGLQLQDEALITCVVPSVFDRGHMHFIDGSGGGYAAAANQLKTND